jgi:4-hydroxy-3-methylbut-2-en-1-yl diphosphate synthase IspG/GcpE
MLVFLLVAAIFAFRGEAQQPSPKSVKAASPVLKPISRTAVTPTARIKTATSHLKGVKIAIMGCIVNGPGEMPDADFGYVGGAPGKVNLYVGKTAVKFNIPEADAVERLQDLIREHGKWVEPAGLVPAGAVPASL